MSGPSVAIVIPCYNTAHFLAEMFQSVYAQTLQPAEIVFVDDGSTDGSADVARTFPGVRMFSQTRQGVSAARNRGLREVTSEFVVFLDSDDRLYPEALRIGVEALQQRPQCAFVYGFCRRVHADGSPMDPAGFSPRPLTHADYRTLLAGSGIVPAGAACHRRAAVESVGGFDPRWRLVQDHDLYMRVARRNPIFCHNEVIVDWRQHGNNNCLKSPSATLRAVLGTIDAQRETFGGDAELEEIARRGKAHWEKIFGPAITREFFSSLKRGRVSACAHALSTMMRHYPQGPFQYVARRMKGNSRPEPLARGAI